MTNLLDILLPIPQPVAASDGTAYRTPAQALLHDLVELKWKRLLPTLQDRQIIAQTRRGMRLSKSRLAKEAGISEPMLSMIETGQRRITEMVMHRIWAALWRLHKEYETPPALEMLIRLEQDADGSMVGVASVREKLEAL